MTQNADFDLRFFDANCMVGMQANRHLATPAGLQQYIDDYRYYDIHGALAFHAMARDYAPDYGNRRLLSEVGGRERFAL